MDLAIRDPAIMIPVVQDDKYSRNIQIQLYENSLPKEVPANISGVVKFCKPDGTGGNYDALPDGTAACTFSGSTVTVALAPQVCTVPGKVRLVVALVDGDTELHTFQIHLEVQANPGLVAVSDDYYNIRGALADSGWTPNKYLGTDANGNVVTKDAPSGSGGSGDGTVTDEQIAEAVAAYMEENPVEGGSTPVKGVDYFTEEEKAEMVEEVLAEIPVSESTDGYTEISGLRQMTNFAVTETDTTITLDITMEGDVSHTHVLNFDANGYPTSITVDGVEIPGTWTVEGAT